MADTQLDPFVQAARACLDEALAAHLISVCDEVSPGQRRRLDVFNEDARALLDRELASRTLRAVVPPRRLVARRHPSWAHLAAAVALLIGSSAVTAMASLESTPRTAQHAEAQYVLHSPPMPVLALPNAESTDVADARTEPDGAAFVPARAAPIRPGLTAFAEPTDLQAKQPDDSRTRERRLAELDRLAQAQWKAGDHGEATRTFEKIVRIGGRSPYAEQAYGELFTLAHRVNATQLQVEYWRGYLRRFPRGRFADAARAGLCRVAAPPARRACWADYLDRYPRGAARTEALRESSP